MHAEHEQDGKVGRQYKTDEGENGLAVGARDNPRHQCKHSVRRHADDQLDQLHDHRLEGIHEVLDAFAVDAVVVARHQRSNTKQQTEHHHGNDRRAAPFRQIDKNVARHEADKQCGNAERGYLLSLGRQGLCSFHFLHTTGEIGCVESEHRSHQDAGQRCDHGSGQQYRHHAATDFADGSELLHPEHCGNHGDQHQRHDDQPQQVDVNTSHHIGPLQGTGSYCTAAAKTKLQVKTEH